MVTGALFLIINVIVIKMYKRDVKSFLRWDIYMRTYRDAFLPIFMSLVFLLVGIGNFYTGDFEGGIFFAALFIILFIIGILFYKQNRNIGV